jgi:hypothetical protein
MGLLFFIILYLRNKFKKKMSKLKIFISFLLFSTLFANAKEKTDPYQTYIDRFADLAVEHRVRYGIPAAITLAQGLVESAAGRSTLAVKGNNHFGIKCHKDWTGDTLLRDDDARAECFRSYTSPEQSFEDHSKFLSRRRYQVLHSIPTTDYEAWANGLKECGYATDPNYAVRLIAVIQRYGLDAYDKDDDSEEVSDFIMDNIRKSHIIRRYRGLYFVIACPGDTYESLADEFGLTADKLKKYNDASGSDIKEWEEVYLEQKKDNAPADMQSITIGEDETVHSISQRLGMTLKAIRKLNPNLVDLPGTRLTLR